MMKLVVHIASIQNWVSETMNVPVMIPAGYSDYTYVFPSISTAVLPKHSGINDYPIGLVDSSHLITFQVARRRSKIVYPQGP